MRFSPFYKQQIYVQQFKFCIICFILEWIDLILIFNFNIF